MDSIFSRSGKLMQFMEWLTNMLHLQILSVLGILIGLVIGGIFPATFTMFAINRKWILGQDFPVNKTFFRLYKKHFLKTNVLGLGITLTGASLLYYLNLFRAIDGAISTVLVVLTFTLFLLYLMTTLYIVPVFVHFDIRLLEVIKHAMIIAISHPLHILLMVLSFIVFWYGIEIVPILTPFIGFSVLSYVLFRVANASFTSIKKKIINQP